MAVTVTITIDDTDEKVLLNDLLGINDWCQSAVSGKINSSWERMRSEWTAKLMDDPSFTDPIPSNKADFTFLPKKTSSIDNIFGLYFLIIKDKSS